MIRPIRLTVQKCSGELHIKYKKRKKEKNTYRVTFYTAIPRVVPGSFPRPIPLMKCALAHIFHPLGPRGWDFLRFSAQVFFRVVFKEASSCFLSGYLAGPDKEVGLPAVSAVKQRAAFSAAGVTHTVKRLSQQWRSRVCVRRRESAGRDSENTWVCRGAAAMFYAFIYFCYFFFVWRWHDSLETTWK